MNGTSNPTAKVYLALLKKLELIDNDQILNNFLEGYPSSSKIMDVGGYTLEQVKLWEEVWSLAKKLRKIKSIEILDRYCFRRGGNEENSYIINGYTCDYILFFSENQY